MSSSSLPSDAEPSAGKVYTYDSAFAARTVFPPARLDWALLVDGQARPGHFELVAMVAERAVEAGFKKPGREGIFGNLVSSHDLVHYIGGSDDYSANMTRRLLLLLESAPVGRDDASPAATSKSPTCGRVKLPHLRMRDEGAGMLRRRWPLRYSRRRFLQAPALAVTLQQVSVVEQTVE